MNHIGQIQGISTVGSMKCLSLLTSTGDLMVDLLDCPGEEWVKKYQGHWVQVIVEKGAKPEIRLLPPPLWRVEPLPTGHDNLICCYCSTVIGTRRSDGADSEEASRKLLENLRSHMSEHHPEKAAELVQ